MIFDCKLTATFCTLMGIDVGAQFNRVELRNASDRANALLLIADNRMHRKVLRTGIEALNKAYRGF